MPLMLVEAIHLPAYSVKLSPPSVAFSFRRAAMASMGRSLNSRSSVASLALYSLISSSQRSSTIWFFMRNEAVMSFFDTYMEVGR